MIVPNSIATPARNRIREMRPQLEKALKIINSDRPLDAEPDMVRKMHRIKAVTGVDDDQAKSIAKYEKSGLFGLSGESRRAAERIQGITADFVGTSFLELARNAANTVGRVVFDNLQPQGSGFMISEDLFMTNNHVITSKSAAKDMLVEFNYEMDINRQPKMITRFTLDPDKFFLTSPENKLDFTVIAIGARTSGTKSLMDFGYCPLLGTDDKHALGEFVNIIQHPDGRYKEVVLRENQLIYRHDTLLHYIADTEPGSSGSPVFNDQWEVIALHHYGEPSILKGRDGKKLRRDVNEGIRISAIIKMLESMKSSIGNEANTLLDKALKASSRHPVIGDEGAQKSHQPSNIVSVPQTLQDGTVTLRIPLDISVRIGNTTQSTQIVSVDATGQEPSAEAVRIDGNYSNRSGYASKFLTKPVPLPKLSDKQKQLAAKKIHTKSGEDPYELKYQHFSIVMNAKRRMAFFTAVNIDGSKWININRDTGEPKESAEAKEIWYEDPRISPDDQCEQGLYDNQKPKRLFDRGHLVRRQDPGWGTINRAKKANADTFHFTNCTPQESAFNQRPKYWQGIENYILDNAKAEQDRVSVFTGPVFDEDDPPYRYVQVPRKFWKILVRVDDGNLLATALLADQSERITRLPERLRGFDDTAKVANYQTSVKEIEQLTGLDFGSLRDHDTFEAGPGESIGKRRILESFEDIKLN